MEEKTQEIARSFIADFPEWGTEPAIGQMKNDIEYILYYSKKPAKDFKKFIAWHRELLDAINIPPTVFLSLCKTILAVSTGLEKNAIANIKAALEFEDHEETVEETDDLPAIISHFHSDIFKDLDSPSSIPNIEKSKTDVGFILQYLSIAKTEENPVYFTKFILWQSNLLNAIGIQNLSLVRMLVTIKLHVDSAQKNVLNEAIQLLINPKKDQNNHTVIPRSELSEAISNQHIELFQKIDPFSNQSFRKNIISDCDKHLEFLEQALDTDSKVLFTEYIGWAASTLDSLGIPSITLVRFLVSIRLILKNSELEDGIDYIDESIRSLMSIGSINEHRSETYLTTSESKKYLAMILDGNRKNATDYIIKLADSGMDLKEIYIEIFQKTQYEIGRLWEKNEVSVAQEHYCTATTQMIMSMLYPRLFNSKSTGKTVVATCVGSELHEIGIRMVADFLELEGWDTYYIGANTPTEAIIESVKNKNADLLAISVTLSPHIKKAIEIIRDVKEVFPGLKILVGGYPFIQDPQLCDKIGADGFVTTAQDVHTKAISLING